jgi:VanZ family protein
MILNTKWPAIIWTGLIFILLVVPSEGIPNKGMLGLPHIDKLAHVVLFGVFVWLWSRSEDISNNNTSRRFFLMSSGYGILMEFIQAGFTNRAFELLDIVADISGAAIAWLLINMTSRYKK